MTNTFRTLSDLATMQHDTAMADLARHNESIRKIEAKISELRNRIHEPPPKVEDDELPLVLISGHNDRWQRWVEHQLVRLNTDLARARAARESLVQAAKVTLGRKSATETMLVRQMSEQRAALRTRFEREDWQTQE